jgi:hypothetical protein
MMSAIIQNVKLLERFMAFPPPPFSICAAVEWPAVLEKHLAPPLKLRISKRDTVKLGFRREIFMSDWAFH